MGNIHTLYKALKLLENIDVYMLCDTSLSWLLTSGEHKIIIPKLYVDEERWCSYIPLGDKCLVTTSGFKWDLGNILFANFFIMIISILTR